MFTNSKKIKHINILSVVGARPNFMKIAPFINAINLYNNNNPENRIKHTLLHTGQHYDIRMSESFFKRLNIPDPDINLEVGSGSHAKQVGTTMIFFEKIILREKPDWVVVVGDVNATLACSVTAKKLNVKVCHIEAGLRSNDMSMPEEINRLVTDRISDLLLTPDRLSVKNLLNEGVPEKNIKFVGNIMIDTLEANRQTASKLSVEEIINENRLTGNKIIKIPAEINSGIRKNSPLFTVVTMHRPSNVDHKEILEPILDFLITEVASDMPVIWPLHPRTEKMLKKFDLWEKAVKKQNMVLLHPVGYHEMLKLNMEATLVMTDSGGLQEECCVLGTPCLTLRRNTERPITLKKYGGASVLTGNKIKKIRKEYKKALLTGKVPRRPDLWDGQTAKRCLDAIINY